MDNSRFELTERREINQEQLQVFHIKNLKEETSGRLHEHCSMIIFICFARYFAEYLYLSL